MAAEKEFRRGAVYGSLAYDVPFPEAYEEAPDQPEERAAQEQARPRAASRRGQGIAPFSIIGILIAAFLCVTAMTARARLLDFSTESAALEAENGAGQAAHRL